MINRVVLSSGAFLPIWIVKVCAVDEEAERWGADLIVMGSRGLGTWNRLLLGSVSSAVVNHAKCSVEIVRSVASV